MMRTIYSVLGQWKCFPWNQAQMFFVHLVFSFPWLTEKGLTVAFTGGQVCLEYWTGPHSCERPLPWLFAREEQYDVFGAWWEMHPLECDSEGTMWDWRDGRAFLIKKATPPEAVGRSEVTRNQCPLSAAHKTHSWCCNSIQMPSGQCWNQLAAWPCLTEHTKMICVRNSHREGA